MKQIRYRDRIFAIVFKSGGELKEGHNFLTEPNENLQVNIINLRKGHVIPDHHHKFIERNIFGTQEFLYVEKGVMKVRFLSREGKMIGEEVLNPGDLVVLLRGGHGFEFLEDSKIIYVKQGPYVSQEIDKKVFEEK